MKAVVKFPCPRTVTLSLTPYAPICGTCNPNVFLVYEGNHVMRCPKCKQAYSCLERAANFNEIAAHDASLSTIRDTLAAKLQETK